MPGKMQLRRVGEKYRFNLEAEIGIDEVGTVTTEMLAAPPPKIAGDFACSADYSSVLWRGQRYSFKPQQRSVIAALLQARSLDRDFMSESELLSIAGSDRQWLREVFRGHSAWGTMIVPGHEHGGPMGTYRLAP